MLSDFDLAGRTAHVAGAEADIAQALPMTHVLAARRPTPRGVDAELARCVVGPDCRGAAILFQGMASRPSAPAPVRRVSPELAELSIRLGVVRMPNSAKRAVGAALGASVFLAQRRRCS